jgi:6-phosphogluconolactonase (cycloisomerase 2 family)
MARLAAFIGVLVSLSLGAAGTAAAAQGSLQFLEQRTETGLDGARGVTASPDGANVYVAGQDADAVVSYSRAANGQLSPLGCVKDDGSGTTCAATSDGLNSARFIAVYGNHVYVTGGDDDAVSVFTRGSGGALVPSSCVEGTGGSSATCTDLASTVNVLDGAEGIAVSPNGAQVYVAAQNASRLVVLNRNVTTGALTFASSTTTGLSNPRELAMAPDGKGVYVASAVGNVVAAFLRDTTTGAVTPAGTTGGIALAVGVAVSPDNLHVYAGGSSSGSVRTYTRNPTTAVLTQAGCAKDTASLATGCVIAEGLAGAESVAVSPDGASVYGAGAADNAVTAMTRQPTTGALGPLECVRDIGAAGGGCATANGLASAHGVAVSPDNKNVYVTGQTDDALAVFARTTTPGPAGPTPTPDPRCSDPTVILVACGSDPRLVVCVGLWVSTCAGFPPPSPVQTCVSLWQNCNGFGGSGNTGPIDMSGLPSSVPTTVGCDESKGNPYKPANRSQAPSTPSSGLRNDLKCLIELHWDGKDPNSDSKVDYQINVERFNTEVDMVSAEEKQGVFLGCAGVDLCDPRATKTLPLVLSGLLDNIFAVAKRPGEPVPVRSSYIDLATIDRICAGGTAIPPGVSDLRPTAAGCRQLFVTLDESIKESMSFLRDRKKKLGVDKPFAAKSSSLLLVDAAAAKRKGAKPRRKATKIKTIVFGGGRAQVTQGGKAKLRIKIPRKVRKQLAKAKRRGAKQVKVTAVLRATIVPGVTSTKRVKIVLKLTPPKKKKKK